MVAALKFFGIDFEKSSSKGKSGSAKQKREKDAFLEDVRKNNPTWSYNECRAFAKNNRPNKVHDSRPRKHVFTIDDCSLRAWNSLMENLMYEKM